jgi:hypothetical protein
MVWPDATSDVAQRVAAKMRAKILNGIELIKEGVAGQGIMIIYPQSL